MKVCTAHKIGVHRTEQNSYFVESSDTILISVFKADSIINWMFEPEPSLGGDP